MVLTGIALCLAISGCRDQSPPRNVILIVIDTLRADRLGAYGSTAGITPFLDRFAQGATVFRNAYASSSWTRPSVASLMTSRHAFQHGVTTLHKILGEEELTLAEALEARGFATAAFVTNFTLMRPTGYAQGIQSYQTLFNVMPKARAHHVHAALMAWLDGRDERERSAPAFLYLHYMEPHFPYSPPLPLVSRFLPRGADAEETLKDINAKVIKASEHLGNEKLLDDLSCGNIDRLEALYNAEVAALDADLEKLFTDLEQRGVLQDSLVVITADHGEEFLEHASLLHGYALYDESIRIPLIMRMPNQVGRRVDRPVSLVDVAPSILDLVDAPTPGEFVGQSLASAVSGWDWQPAFLRALRRLDAPVLAELQPLGGSRQSVLHTTAIIQGPAKLLRAPDGAVESYDLKQNPYEEYDGVVLNVERREELLGRIHEIVQPIADKEDNTLVLDAATQERLEALGYNAKERESAGAATDHPAAGPAPVAQSRPRRCVPVRPALDKPYAFF